MVPVLFARPFPNPSFLYFFQENLDSNRSLSDDEELHDAVFYSDFSKNFQSHYSHEVKMQPAPASQVNSFTGDGHHSTFATSKEEFRQRENSTLQKEILPSKSEMINQLLDTDHGRLAHLDGRKERLDDFGYDSISDEEDDTRRRFPFTDASAGAKKGGYDNLEKKPHEVCEWSTILDEADELAGLRGNMCNSFHPSLVPEDRIYHKGVRGRSKFKISLPSLSSMENFSRGSLSKDRTYSSSEEDIEGPADWYYFKHGTKEDTATQLIENSFEESAEPANRPLVGAPSVSELLEDMQKKDPSSRGIQAVDNIKGKERQKSFPKRSLLHLGSRALHKKDAPDFTGEISSEDEHIDQHYRTAQIVKEQTMADLFLEAFNTSTDERPEIPKNNKFGFQVRLQNIIKLEKDRHMDYLKGLQARRTPLNESNAIIVRILSRVLDAKLKVCQCLFGENSKILDGEKGLREGFGHGETMKKTIIFSPTFCNNVELEVGSTVCIHRPWKEVEVNGEIIILCTYFSTPL